MPVIYLLIINFLFFCVPAISQETPLPKKTPPPLPAPSEGVNAGMLVNSANAAEFRSIIIPEFYPLVRARLIEMDSVSGLRFNLSDFALAPATASGADEFPVQTGGLLKDGYRIKSGLPFPDWEQTQDPKIKAAEFVWNMQSVSWNNRLFHSDFQLLYIEEGKETKSLKGQLKRLYPAMLSAEDKSIQLFRELIQFNSPAIIRDLNYLTFRFLGEEEDMIWFSSPSLKKVRELTGSNRADSILDTSFSPDDFFGWSGKAEKSDPELNNQMTVLVPFASFDTKVLNISSPGCSGFKKSQSATVPDLRWNYNSHKFPDAFPWLPTDTVFTPRKVIRIELIPRDPFSLYGRQILYVDKELFIPYYKFVFNRAGYLWKTIFNVPAFYISKDKTRKHYVTDFVIVEDRQNKVANIVELDNINFCDQYTESIKVSNFDPLKLLPPVPTPVVVPKKK